MTINHTATGIKLGNKGKVAKTPEAVAPIFGMVSKGEARKARKHLFKLGHRAAAAARAA
jgi:hypothetical protein